MKEQRLMNKQEQDAAFAQASKMLEELRLLRESSPDDLRAKGWSVGVHNDYRLNGKAMTFWLMTHKDGVYYIGEAETDAAALNIIRERVKVFEKNLVTAKAICKTQEFTASGEWVPPSDQVMVATATPRHPDNCECSSCWQNMEGHSKR